MPDEGAKRKAEAEIDRFRLRYQVVVGRAMLDRPERVDQETRSEAEPDAFALVIDAEQRLGPDRSGRDRGGPVSAGSSEEIAPALRLFLDQNEAVFLLLLAGLLRDRPGANGREEPIPDRRALLDALRAPREFAPSGDRLVDFVETHCVLDYRSRYNLACYLSRGRELDRAAEQLTAVFAEAPPDLRSWARRDPSLENLRTAKLGPFADPKVPDGETPKPGEPHG